MYVFGVSKPSDLVKGSPRYRYRSDIPSIRCPVLVMDGTAEDLLGAGQPKRLFDELACPKECILFGPDEAGDLHCQAGALEYACERMFGWLDETRS